VNSNNTGRTAP